MSDYHHATALTVAIEVIQEKLDGKITPAERSTLARALSALKDMFEVEAKHREECEEDEYQCGHRISKINDMCLDCEKWFTKEIRKAGCPNCSGETITYFEKIGLNGRTRIVKKTCRDCGDIEH